jgi:hypothetical protein
MIDRPLHTGRERQDNVEYLQKVSYFGPMNEKEVEARFEELRNDLKGYQEQLDSFREDLKILFEHRLIACRDILDTAKQVGNAAFDQSDVHRCQEFMKKYNLRKGY